MATIIDKNKKYTFSEDQQKEIVRLCNEAYDKGGADVLKIVLSTAASLAEETPELAPYNRFVQVLVEGIRKQLQETVTQEQIQKEQEKPLVEL
jgi:hypothetical protein